eukprot:12995977-Ditylum_brightwellii.AAC.1
MGVIAFLLLSGEAPFGGCYGEEEDKRLVVVDPTDRPTAKEAQKLPWLCKDTRRNGFLSPIVAQSLFSFKDLQNDIQKVMCE